MTDASEYTVLCDSTSGYYRTYLRRQDPLTFQCNIMGDCDDEQDHWTCLKSPCTVCPYDMPHDYITAIEATFSGLLRSFRHNNP